MPTPEPEPEIAPAAPPPDDGARIRPITVDECHRMLEAGILYEGEPVELIDGLLIAVPPEGPLHAATVMKLNEELVRRFSGRAMVRPGNPLTLPPISEPQPDFTLVRPQETRYLDRHPSADDALLVVEVSRTTLRYDRGRKLRVYAAAGIPEVWIIDLVHRQVEVFSDPVDGAYSAARVADDDESIAPRAFPDDAIPIAALLP